MKAVGYIRVSTQEQAECGVSLDAQRAKIAAFCGLNEHELVATFSDEGVSGAASREDRPGLDAALTQACKHKAVLVVYSLSRFSRSAKHTIDYSICLRECGAQLASITEGIDTTTPMGKFFFGLMAHMNELERDLISERTKTALAYKKAQGERVGGIPYGFTVAADGKTLVEHAEEQQVIERARALKGEGLTVRAIAERMAGEGVVTRTGRPMNKSTVADLLKG